MNPLAPYIQSQIKLFKNDPHKAIPTTRPFITISRQSGAYGTTIAESLVEYLKLHDPQKDHPWTKFDKELIDRVMQDHDLPQSIINYFPESTVSEIKDALEELFDLHPSQYALIHKTSETIIHLAQLGFVVLVGRGANIITSKLPHGVHVRLTGSFEKRASHMQEYLNISEKESRIYVLKEEQARKNYIHKYFEKDIDNPLLYDLIINTDTIPIPTAVQIIGDLALGHCQ